MVTDSVRIGEMLLARGLISREQLDRALEVQTSGDGEMGISPGERLGKVILRLGLVEPMELVRCLCAQKGKINFLVVDDYLIEPALADRIPRRLALELLLLPLVRLDEDTVLAATTRLLPGDKVDFLHQLTGAHLEQIVVEDSDFRQKVFRCYRAVAARKAGARRTGDLLVDEGLITAEQRDWALAEAAEQQKKVGRVLIENGIIREEELFGAFARLKGVPLISAADIERVKNAARIAQVLPRNYAVYNEVVPYRVTGDTVYVVTSDPNLDAGDVAQIFHARRARVHLSTASDMKRILLSLYSWQEESSREAPGHAPDRALVAAEARRTGGPGALPADPQSRLIYGDIINNVLLAAASQGASHVHIENYEEATVVRFRVGGKLREVAGLHVTRSNVARVLAVLKDLAGLDPKEVRRPQAGALERQTIEGRVYDFRVHTQPALFGENVVIRILAPPEGTAEVLGLELAGPVGVKYLAAARSGPGVLLLVSPATRQRSHLAYATLNILKEDRQKKIVTVEDPIESSVAGIIQSEVSHEVDYTFDQAVASFQRTNADVVYVSDLETGECAGGCFRLAQAGCLVLAGMRASASAEALDRLVSWGFEPTTWPDQLLGVLLRRSLQALCPHCKRSYQPGAEVLAAVYGDSPPSGPFFRALGCPECEGTGRRGEVVFSEYLAPDESVRRGLGRGRAAAAFLEGVPEDSFFSLRQDIREKANAALVDITEAAVTLLGLSPE